VPTWRQTQKANRRTELLERAAGLFAERGYAGVTTSDIGEAAGMTGPALYRHFSSKEAILAELLGEASERLLQGTRDILSGDRRRDVTALRRLIAFHVEFATSAPDVIRIQDRELAALPAVANHRVRRLQREYVQVWDGVLAGVRPEMSAPERQTRLLATFGLLNSTPHSGADADAAAILARMAEDALLGTRGARSS